MIAGRGILRVIVLVQLASARGVAIGHCGAMSRVTRMEIFSQILAILGSNGDHFFLFLKHILGFFDI